MSGASNHLFWITSRAAGTSALVLASVSVGLGALMGGRLLKGRLADRRALHEALSLSVMVALGVHALALVGDSWLRPSLRDVTIPFTWSYRPALTSLGIVSGWALVALGLSYYLRARIGVRRWRALHRFSVLAWLGGLVHGLALGTDAGQAWFLILVGVTALPALLALAARLSGAAQPAPGAAGSGAAAPGAGIS